MRESENKLHREDRYTWRHNNVLLAIYLEVKERLAVANKLGTSAGVLPGGAAPAERKVHLPASEARLDQYLSGQLPQSNLSCNHLSKLALSPTPRTFLELQFIYFTEQRIGCVTLIYQNVVHQALPMSSRMTFVKPLQR